MITELNHITLSISNMEKSLEFYQSLLGFKAVAVWDGGAYLVINKCWLCLSLDETYQKPDGKDYSHIAFSLSEAEFKALCRPETLSHLRFWKKNTSFGDSLYLLDPDGHQLELHTKSLGQRLDELNKNPYCGLRLSPNWQTILEECQLP